jgi:anthranilate phosphoribosyltransferase
MKSVLAAVLSGARLDAAEAGRAMGVIMDGDATPAQIGALLAGLAVRGETVEEVVGFARIMRERAEPLRSSGALDTCGTGGDGTSTFNISTLASLTVAATGVPVVKHGNRSASSQCGSADVLEALGVRIDAPSERVQRCLDETGWTFLFAPRFHASTRHAVEPRRDIGARTAFNLLGPLTNPARPTAQLVGVPRPELLDFMAACLERLGIERGWVVHGDGMDEVSPVGETEVVPFGMAGSERFTLKPADAGLEASDLDALRCGGVEESAELARGILAGERGPRRDAVVLNAAAALVAGGHAKDVAEGARRAGLALERGHVATQLERVRKALDP